MLLFHFAGLLTECDGDGLCTSSTPNSLLFNFLVNPEHASDSTLWTKIGLALTGVSAALVLGAGLYINNVELAVMGPIAVFLLTMLWDFVAVFSRVRESSPVLSILLFGPLMLLFIITILDWWRGRD